MKVKKIESNSPIFHPKNSQAHENHALGNFSFQTGVTQLSVIINLHVACTSSPSIK